MAMREVDALAPLTLAPPRWLLLAVATLVRLAADGLFFAELLGFAPPEGALRKQVLGALLSLTEKPRR